MSLVDSVSSKSNKEDQKESAHAVNTELNHYIYKYNSLQTY